MLGTTPTRQVSSFDRDLCTFCRAILVRGIRGVVLCYLIPAVTVYPLFAWWSQLVEHRWYQSIQDTGRAREFDSGRVIDAGFFTRRLIEFTVLPFGDSLHLAHSLYPSVRWNYLPAIHRIHMQADPRYRSLRVGGLFFSARSRTSLLKDALLDFGEPIPPTRGVD